MNIEYVYKNKLKCIKNIKHLKVMFSIILMNEKDLYRIIVTSQRKVHLERVKLAKTSHLRA